MIDNPLLDKYGLVCLPEEFEAFLYSLDSFIADGWEGFDSFFQDCVREMVDRGLVERETMRGILREVGITKKVLEKMKDPKEQEEIVREFFSYLWEFIDDF